MTDFWKDSPILEARLRRVAVAIDSTIDIPGYPLREATAGAAEPNGKLLRPALLIIGSTFGRAADPARIESLAAAIELLHVATLVHDDIIDDADKRRGGASLHASIGIKKAVLAGDWLFSRCFLLSSESAEPENARALGKLIAAVCAAEIAQDMSKYSYRDSIRGYFRTIAGKTAALFSLALHAGATEAKAGPRIIQTLRRAGYNMGMAFQVIDDILDFESAERVARKPVGKDIAEGLCTLPLIYALKADPKEIRTLLELVGHGDAASSADAAAEAASRAIELGGTARARGDAKRFTDRALVEIGRLPRTSAREELHRLAERLLRRDY